jgi:cysteine-rich repeat protein
METGYQCTSGQPSYCWDECGDGKVSAREKCDDGNGEIDDGCNPDCQIEPGYSCTGAGPSICTHPNL